MNSPHSQPSVPNLLVTTLENPGIQDCKQTRTFVGQKKILERRALTQERPTIIFTTILAALQQFLQHLSLTQAWHHLPDAYLGFATDVHRCCPFSIHSCPGPHWLTRSPTGLSRFKPQLLSFAFSERLNMDITTVPDDDQIDAQTKRARVDESPPVSATSSITMSSKDMSS